MPEEPFHPAPSDHIAPRHMAVFGIEFEFYGKAAHAALDPHQGVNALDAVIQTFVNVGLLRQQGRPEARIHGVITHGGSTRQRSEPLIHAAPDILMSV